MNIASLCFGSSDCLTMPGFGTHAPIRTVTGIHYSSGSVNSASPGFSPARTGSSRPARPTQLDPALTEHMAGGLDPEEISEMSHASAAALLDRVHHTQDSQIVQRVITLVDTEGVDLIAELWSHSEPESLPGILWRLYLLRTWMRKNTSTIAYLWRLGEPVTTASSAIAGVDQAPSEQDIAHTADSILSGAFTGDFAVALERASAFVDVVMRGMTVRAKALERKEGAQGDSAAVIANLNRTASNLRTTANDFRHGANLWRRGRLE